jgi:hypothetical protein
MITSESVDKIFPALVKAQSMVKNAPKNADNPFFNSKYADLATIIDTAKEPTSHNGLAVLQSPSTEDGKVKITTRIIHDSGQWVEDSITFTLHKTDPQSVGSAITYGRRYALAAMLGIAQEDDDGNRSSDTTANTKKSTDSQMPSQHFNDSQIPDPSFVHPKTLHDSINEGDAIPAWWWIVKKQNLKLAIECLPEGCEAFKVTAGNWVCARKGK